MEKVPGYYIKYDIFSNGTVEYNQYDGLTSLDRLEIWTRRQLVELTSNKLAAAVLLLGALQLIGSLRAKSFW